MWQRQVIALAIDSSQDGVDQTRGAALADLASQCDGIVDGGGGGNAIEVQQLKRGHPQNVEHFRIELRDRTSRKCFDDRVERSLPAQCSGRDLAGERAIALIWQPRTNLRERAWQIRPSCIDRSQHLVRGEPGRRDHGRPSNIPGLSFLPLRNSRAVIARRPSGWTIRMRSTWRSPVAIDRTSPLASMTLPPGTSAVSSVNLVR